MNVWLEPTRTDQVRIDDAISNQVVRRVVQVPVLVVVQPASLIRDCIWPRAFGLRHDA